MIEYLPIFHGFALRGPSATHRLFRARIAEVSGKKLAQSGSVQSSSGQTEIQQ